MNEAYEFYQDWQDRLVRNHRPTPSFAKQVFHWANLVDPKGRHTQSNCSRCYRNAVAALVRWAKKYENNIKN